MALATGDLSVIGPADGQLLVVLSRKRSHPTAEYQRVVRDTLVREFPDDQFWYQPADIVTQVLNQGLAAPIDVQIAGRAKDSNYAARPSGWRARSSGCRVQRTCGFARSWTSRKSSSA